MESKRRRPKEVPPRRRNCRPRGRPFLCRNAAHRVCAPYVKVKTWRRRRGGYHPPARSLDAKTLSVVRLAHDTSPKGRGKAIAGISRRHRRAGACSRRGTTHRSCPTQTNGVSSIPLVGAAICRPRVLSDAVAHGDTPHPSRFA